MSAAEVPKIINRADISNVYAALRTVSGSGQRPRGFFDLSMGYRMVDTWRYGQSLYQTLAPSFKDIVRKLALPKAEAKLENMLLIYFYLQNTLPESLIEFLNGKTQIDIDIGAQVCYAEAREARKQLRLKFETNAVHITLERGRQADLVPSLESFLKENDLPFNRILPAGRHAFVEMAHHNEKYDVVKKLQSANLNGVVVTAVPIDLKTSQPSNVKPLRPIDAAKMSQLRESGLENLQQVGFFELLEKHGHNKPQQKQTDENKEKPVAESEEVVLANSQEKAAATRAKARTRKSLTVNDLKEIMS